MHNTDAALKKAHKPFDVVTDNHDNVGFISEVRINAHQSSTYNQLTYSVTWLVLVNYKEAHNSFAYAHGDLKIHCNMFVKIAEGSCHPMGNNERFIQRLIMKG